MFHTPRSKWNSGEFGEREAGPRGHHANHHAAAGVEHRFGHITAAQQVQCFPAEGAERRVAPQDAGHQEEPRLATDGIARFGEAQDETDDEAACDVDDEGAVREGAPFGGLDARTDEVSQGRADDGAGYDPGVAHLPVLPWPPAPRAVPESSAQGSNCTSASRVTTSWAMRSPCCTTCVISGAMAYRVIMISPR